MRINNNLFFFQIIINKLLNNNSSHTRIYLTSKRPIKLVHIE